MVAVDPDSEREIMRTIELFTRDECSLCDEVKPRAERLASEFGFRLVTRNLDPADPLFEKYRNDFPVLLAENGNMVSGRVSDDDLSALFLSLTPPPRLYYAAKFLQALAIVVVFFGFMYGLMGDMWTDLYFFLGGIGIFLIGWMIEKQEARSRRKRVQARMQV